jgi:hypothetical protein
MPETAAYPISPPTITAPMASGIRRAAAARGEGVSGISFVIRCQLRLCRAYITFDAGHAFREAATINGGLELEVMSYRS